MLFKTDKESWRGYFLREDKESKITCFRYIVQKLIIIFITIWRSCATLRIIFFLLLFASEYIFFPKVTSDAGIVRHLVSHWCLVPCCSQFAVTLDQPPQFLQRRKFFRKTNKWTDDMEWSRLKLRDCPYYVYITAMQNGRKHLNPLKIRTLNINMTGNWTHNFLWTGSSRFIIASKCSVCQFDILS
jgi:hypothetical protein